jgi:hypothetical protein
VAPGLHSLSHALSARCSAHGHCPGTASDDADRPAIAADDEHEHGACSLCWFLQHTRWQPGHLPASIQPLPQQTVGRVRVQERRLEVHLGRGQALARGPPREATTHTA